MLPDLFGITWAIGVIGGLTSLSRFLAQLVMAETLPRMSTHEPTAAFLIGIEKKDEAWRVVSTSFELHFYSSTNEERSSGLCWTRYRYGGVPLSGFAGFLRKKPSGSRLVRCSGCKPFTPSSILTRFGKFVEDTNADQIHSDSIDGAGRIAPTCLFNHICIRKGKHARVNSHVTCIKKQHEQLLYYTTPTTASGGSCGRYCTSSTPTAPAAGSGLVIKTATATINGKSVTILTNAQGLTLYYRTSTAVLLSAAAAARQPGPPFWLRDPLLQPVPPHFQAN